MGYRHYIGYIPKSRLPEIMKKVEELKEKYEKPRKEYLGEYTDDMITTFLQDQAILIYEIGKLYTSDFGKSIDKILYKNQTENFSSENYEFFFVKNDILLELSYAYMDYWYKYTKKHIDKFIEILNSDNPLTKEQKEMINNNLNYYLGNYRNANIQEEREKKKSPYFWTDDYVSCGFYTLYKWFDLENNVLCIWAE